MNTSSIGGALRHLAYHPLRVEELRPETSDASTLVFGVPRELPDSVFGWVAGQHLNLRLQLDGEELRRSYSISASPLTGPLRITVKRIPDGRVSNHLLDRVKPGQEIDVMPPQGGFCLEPSPTARRTHYFFAAGSGITPVFAMVKTMLLGERHSVAHLLYGNRNSESILFRDALSVLGREHPDRLTVVQTLSQPGWWSADDGWKGRIDDAAISRFLAHCRPYAQDTQYYVCGPGEMNEQVETALLDLDVPRSRIHREHFRARPVTADESSFGSQPARLRILGSSAPVDVEVAAGQTLLRAMIAAGLEPPYSCEAGVCSTCRAQLTSGTVHMRSRAALEDDEIAAGCVLTCQAVATSPQVEVRIGDGR